VPKPEGWTKVAGYLPITDEVLKDTRQVYAWQSFYPFRAVTVEDVELAEQKTAYQQAVIEDVAAEADVKEAWEDITERVRYVTRRTRNE
jgi:hypothetical protein